MHGEPRCPATRPTISIPPDLEAALRAYQRNAEPAPPTLSGIVEAALREFLGQRGFLELGRGLRLTPAPRGSGLSDVSTDRDRYLE